MGTFLDSELAAINLQALAQDKVTGAPRVYKKPGIYKKTA
jgi:hypothetical protein